MYVTSHMGCLLLDAGPLSSYIYMANIAKHIVCAADHSTGYPYISWKYDLSLTSCNLSCPLKISSTKLQPVKYDYIWHLQSTFQPLNKKSKSSVGLAIKLEVKLAGLIAFRFWRMTVCVWASPPAIQLKGIKPWAWCLRVRAAKSNTLDRRSCDHFNTNSI